MMRLQTRVNTQSSKVVLSGAEDKKLRIELYRSLFSASRL